MVSYAIFAGGGCCLRERMLSKLVAEPFWFEDVPLTVLRKNHKTRQSVSTKLN
jgi:hypothetical protein